MKAKDAVQKIQPHADATIDGDTLIVHFNEETEWLDGTVYDRVTFYYSIDADGYVSQDPYLAIGTDGGTDTFDPGDLAPIDSFWN